MKSQNLLLGLFTFLISISASVAQTSTEFWFAPPEVTSGHVVDFPVLLRIASADQATTITIDMPANPSFNGGSPIVITMAAYTSHSEDLSAFLAEIETGPMDQVMNTGIHISSTEDITVYYEVNTNYNPEIFALKGLTGLGTEFYTPFQKNWTNGGYTPTPYTSFDIVATEDNTTIIIYPRVDLEGGHPALESYSVTLNKGQTYSCGVLDINAPNPVGTAIASDKPIAVSVKDDSVSLSQCRDLIGDQLVPVEITGKEYIVNKGYLLTDDLLIITATDNVTTVEIDGVYQTTLFTGESFEYSISNPLTYVQTSKPVYAMHITGFGCEIGGALLPPLNCAGSEQVSFTRSSDSFFALNLLVRSGAEGSFKINGDATLIEASDFQPVPGTAGEWLGAQISYEESEIAVDQAYLITNDMDVFAMGLINGGATSGCRFGYFSEFAAQIFITAGDDATTCANINHELSGMVSGGSTSGIWTTNGTGEFVPSPETFNATYVPGALDLLNGQVVLTLTSTGPCYPETDQMILNFAPEPIVVAGEDLNSCANSSMVNLNGTVQNANGGLWSGGNGVFGSTTDLSTTYTPSQSEIDAGMATLTLTSTQNGFCEANSDNIVIDIAEAPTANAGTNISVCANNTDVQLTGSITHANGGLWSGGDGSFLPSPNALNAIYLPTQGEVNTGILTLTLTTLDNGSCIPVSDDVLITFSPAPTADAGGNQTLCSNNSQVQLDGNVTIATGGYWTGGTGSFIPISNILNPVYSPSQEDLDNGSVTLTLTTSGQGNCVSVTDQMTVNFTPAPIVSAGNDITTCAENLDIQLLGFVNGPTTTGVWSSNGTGSFTPSAEDLNATYIASVQDANMGEVTLTLSATNIGGCNAVSDELTVTILPQTTINTSGDMVLCSNNVDVNVVSNVSPFNTEIIWTTTGGGIFSPSASILNPTYIPSASDLTSGGVTLTVSAVNSCNDASGDIDIDFTPSPIVNAGNDQQLCASIQTVNLLGQVNGATSTGVWTSNGTGSFANSNDLQTQFTPSIADISLGQVTLTLTSTNNGNCLPVFDQVVIYFSPSIEVYAGEDQQVCVSSNSTQLNGQVTNGGGTGTWTTSGTGSFNNADLLEPNYTFSAQDIAGGAIFLTLTSTNNGDCDGSLDIMSITFGQNVFASAGLDLGICGSEDEVQLNGFASGGSNTGIWTTSGSGTFSDATMGNAFYTPSQDDINNGEIDLYFTSTNNGSCQQGQDTTILTIDAIPILDLGNDRLICGEIVEMDLNADFSGAESVLWSTTGTGQFTMDVNIAETKYIPSLTDSLIGSFYVMAETTGNGSCMTARDTVIVRFGGRQQVEAGQDIRVCGSSLEYALTGAVIGENVNYYWTTNGSGSIVDSTALTTTYNPGIGEENIILFYLNTTDQAGCPAIVDTVLMATDELFVLNLGEDQIYCNSVESIPVTADTGGSESIVWTTSGTGSFDNSNMASTVYSPSENDAIIGEIEFYLQTLDDNACGTSSEAVTITFDNSITADFDISGACLGSPISFTNQSVLLSGEINNILWSFDQEGSSSAEDAAWTFSETGTYDVTLAIELMEGCTSTITKQVEVTERPNADFVITGELLSEHEITFNNITSNVTNFDWDFGTGDDYSDEENPIFSYNEEGEYQVMLIAYDAAGCADSTMKIIQIMPGDILPPKTPTGFSPNGDGENDIFYVRGGPFSQINFSVYNEWGELIFNSNDAEIGWDGTFKGKDQPLGTYFYTVTATTEDGFTYDKSGKITLIR